MSKYKVEIGQVFGEYVVIDTSPQMKKGYCSFKVKCSCGEVKLVDAYALFKGKSTRCCKCNKRSLEYNPAWKGYKTIPGKVLSRIKRQALQRNIKCFITLEDIWNTLENQNKKCALTGLDVSFIQETASVDRIDSNKEYSKDNIQIVHKDVNIMKNVFDQEYFIDICKKIAITRGKL